MARSPAAVTPTAEQCWTLLGTRRGRVRPGRRTLRRRPGLREETRGAGEVARLAGQRLTICGAGTLGPVLADDLARQGFKDLRVIDRDRVEEHNVGTQLYGESDVGAWTVEVLRQRLFRAAGVEIEAVRKALDARTARGLLRGGGLVVDTFDNSAARRLVQEHCRA